MDENNRRNFIIFRSGFRPDLSNTRILSKVSLPIIKVSADFTATAKLLMLNIKPEGVLTLDLSMYSLSNLKSISIREN